MFEEFELINSTCEQKLELPAIIRVGNFRRGHTKVPVLIPIDLMNGLCFETNSKTQDGALRQMQYMAIDLIMHVSPEILSLTFVDFSLNTNFPILHSLKLPNIKFISDRNNLKNELDVLYNHACYISTKCLMADYANLKEYNLKSSSKEAYHFLILSNFPKDYREDEINIISEIVNEGARCGMQVIMNLDRRYFPYINSYNRSHFVKLLNLQNDMTLIDTTQQFAQIKNFTWNPNAKTIKNWFTKYKYSFDDYSVTDIKKLINNHPIVSKVNVDHNENFLSIPIGLDGGQRVYFEMGKKACVYHGLIAGQSGTGKSTLLNNIITTIAEKYPPDEIRLYLLDYKLGVEFKIFRDHPNVELLLLDNNRLSGAVGVLKMLEKEMQKRELLFERDLTVQDIDSYNKKNKDKLPRILLIIDEVQQLFKNYETQRQINPLIKLIARQGRSFGIHMLFSSQSFDGCNIAPDILSQMSMRIAFTLASSQECRAILGGDNDIPKNLPYFSAVYNTKNGNKDGNIIVKMDNYNRDQIIPKLMLASKKYEANAIKKTIITRDSPIFSNNDIMDHNIQTYKKEKSGTNNEENW